MAILSKADAGVIKNSLLKRTPITILFLLIINSLLTSQKIEGIVLDSLQNPLPGCTVMLISQIDSTLANFELTGNKGKFVLRNVDQGKYQIQVSFLGYVPYKDSIKMVEDDLLLDKIVLKVANNRLDEIVIEGEVVPIVTSKDTFIYNANAFNAQNNEVVEDLLRKMPGVEIESDGTIIAQGEKVEEVLVDGKKFFDGDTKTATQNLPAKAIDKIKFYDKESDEAEFTGIKDGKERKTMDLGLKKEYKNGQFGKVHAGIGSSDFEDLRYQASGNMNRFDRNMNLSLIAGMDNTNPGSGNNFAPSFNSRGDQGLTQNLVNNYASSGDTNKKNLAVNMNLNRVKGLQFNTSYRLKSNATDLITNSFRESYFSETQNLLEVDESSSNRDALNQNINSRLKYQIDSTQEISINGKLSFQNSDNIIFSESETLEENMMLFSTSSFSGNSNNTDSRWRSSFGYRKKIGEKRRIISTNVFYASNNTDRNNFSNSQNEFILTPRNDFTQILQNDNNNHSKDYGFEIKYSEPLKNSSHLSVSYDFRNTKTESDVKQFDIVDSLLLFNTELSERYLKGYKTHTTSIAYQQIFETFEYRLNSSIVSNQLSGQFFDGSSPINNSSLNFIPSVDLRYNINNSKRLKFVYSTNIREPSLNQLQPTINNQDPFNIYAGNPDLRPEYRHKALINFGHNDRFNFISFYANLSGNLTSNRITSRTSINEFYVRRTSPVNVKKEWDINTYANFSAPIKPINIKVKTGLRYLYGRSIIFLNDVETPSSQNSISYDFAIENRDKSFFDLALTSRFSFNNVKYANETESAQSYNNQALGAKVMVTGIDRWQFQTNFSLRRFNQKTIGESNTIPNLSLRVSRFLTPGDRLEMRITINDILNKNIGISNSSSANSTSYSSSNAIGRFFLFSVYYNLKVF